MTSIKPRSPGRPRLKAGKGKEAIVVLRLTEDERLRHKALAEKKGLSLSAWIRWVLGQHKELVPPQ